MPDRAGFLRHAKAAVERAAMTGAVETAAFIDLDGFEPIDDRRGHEAGDTSSGKRRSVARPGKPRKDEASLAA